MLGEATGRHGGEGSRDIESSELHERLEALRSRAARLDPDAATRARWTEAATAHVGAWTDALATLPPVEPDHEAAEDALAAVPIQATPRPIEEILAVVHDAVDHVGVHEPSADFFGFIPGGGLYSGVLGDFLAAGSNRYVGRSFGAPGAARLERALLAWMAGFLGFPDDCGGDLTSGASMATLSAVVTARDARAVRSADVPRSVVYLTPQTHAACAKALRIAGLAEAVVEEIPLDERHRMRVDVLAERIEANRSVGLEPWLVIATAGTTDTGAIDPLGPIADVAERHGLWLHVDAAYGGPFALTETGAARLRGIERADSVVLDAHKSLFVPFGLGAVLVRDAAAMRAAFTGEAAEETVVPLLVADGLDLQSVAASSTNEAACLRDTAQHEDVSAADVSAELTRPFRGMRLWLSLQLAGEDAFRAALDEKLLLAGHAHRVLSTMDGVEVGPPPELGVVAFSVVGSTPEIADARTQAVVDAVQAEGQVFVSSTVIGERVAIRMAINVFRTHLEHVDRALDVLAAHIDRVMTDVA